MTRIERFTLDEVSSDGSSQYRALLVDYVAQHLGLNTTTELDRQYAELIIEKANGRFAYVAFIVERLTRGQLDRQTLNSAEGGEGIYRAWLANLNQEHGAKRADALREILALLLAAEQAHSRVFGDLLVKDPVDGTALTSLSAEQFEGLSVDVLGELTNQYDAQAISDAERYDPYLVVNLQLLQGALWISRAGTGVSTYRLALKEFANVAAEDALLGPDIKRAQSVMAERLSEVAEALAAAQPVAPDGQMADPTANQAWHRRAEWQLFEALLPYGRVGEWKTDVLYNRLRDLAWARGVQFNHEGQYSSAIALYDDALAMHLAVDAQNADTSRKNQTASLLMSRGKAKYSEENYGPGDAIGDFDVTIGIRESLHSALEPMGQWAPVLRNELASAYMNRGVTKLSLEGHGPGEAIADCDVAIEIMEPLRSALEPSGQWIPLFRNELANAYVNRGNAKKLAEDHGPRAAIDDYDLAIKIEESLRSALEPSGQWVTEFRNDLANAYMNRGNAKQSAVGHGPKAAIDDYDVAIKIRESLRSALEPLGQWSPEFRNDLTKAYLNRGIAKESAEGHGPYAAIADYDVAIKFKESLRSKLEPLGLWIPEFRNELAGAYMNRGNAKQSAEGHGPYEAIADYDVAIEINESLRSALEPSGQWAPEFRNGLANTYLSRGTAKQSLEDHGPYAAIDDYDAAIKIMESLRSIFEPSGQWLPEFRDEMAIAYMNRGIAKESTEDQALAVAIDDYDAAIEIGESLRSALEPSGQWLPGFRNELAYMYMYRGIAKDSVEGYGPGVAIDDYNAAIEIRESLRSVLDPSGPWTPEYRNDLAIAYMNRGNAKQSAEGHGPGAAIDDYDVAIEIMESLRTALEQWVPGYQNDLALALINRAKAADSLVKNEDENAKPQACSDTRRAITIWETLVKNNPTLTNTITPYLEFAQNLLTELGCEPE